MLQRNGNLERQWKVTEVVNSFALEVYRAKFCRGKVRWRIDSPGREVGCQKDLEFDYQRCLRISPLNACICQGLSVSGNASAVEFGTLQGSKCCSFDEQVECVVQPGEISLVWICLSTFAGLDTTYLR